MASSMIYHRDVRKKKNDCLMSVHTSAIYESEKISASSRFGEEGLLKMKKKRKIINDTKSQNHICADSRVPNRRRV